MKKYFGMFNVYYFIFHQEVYAHFPILIYKHISYIIFFFNATCTCR